MLPSIVPYTNSSSYSHSLVFPLSVWRQNEPLFSLQKNWFLRLSSRAFRTLFRRTAWPGFSVYYCKPWQKANRYLCPLCSQDHASKVGGLKKTMLSVYQKSPANRVASLFYFLIFFRMQPPSSAVSNASFRPSVMRRDSASESEAASVAGLRGGLGKLNIQWWKKRLVIWIN